MDKMEYDIRLATQKDIEKIAEIYVDSWQKTYK